MNKEQSRLKAAHDRTADWQRWGPYLSERQWGTVREDYSPDGSAWESFSHDHARRRAYRWGEDGLQGWTDRHCRLCFAPALWNGQDTILKERLFGLTGNEGNHGEDVKECYYYLDSTPTHSYTKALYKYPQSRYPYSRIRDANRNASRLDDEIELADTHIFDENRYFDIVQEVAKRAPNDMLWRITATNHGPDPSPLHLLPTVWFRNIWKWGRVRGEVTRRPAIRLQEDGSLLLTHEELGNFKFYLESSSSTNDSPWLFTDNETNYKSVFGFEGPPYSKDAFHRHVIHGDEDCLHPGGRGTKAAAHCLFEIPPGETVEIRCRLVGEDSENSIAALDDFDETFEERITEADRFYANLIPANISRDDRLISRQGYAGLLWTKQFYHYIIPDWLKGDGDGPAPPASRKEGRNHDWDHFFARDILSMPDKWEYPWFAAWDTAFHMIPMAKVDPEFSKHQLLLFLREWYMHPNGQLPAYEWNFSDVNPPVHAWAVWRVYKISSKKGERDLLFLERAFQKLLLNFNWWVNRKDLEGRHIFGGGFLGLDNIGVFDRSHALPEGGQLHQADGTAWMGFYCLTMLSIALELALERPAYEDIASKFFEHFVQIADAINAVGGTGLWDEEDGFYYDQLIVDGAKPIPMKIRSLVGLLPMCAVTVIKEKTIRALPNFKSRMEWFLENRPELAGYVSYVDNPDGSRKGHRLLALPSKDRLLKCVSRLLDPDEFLSDHGVRSLSKAHGEKPFIFKHGKETHEVPYTPGESTTAMFGGNSNWRGPIWFPINYLLVEALQSYAYFYKDSIKLQTHCCPDREITFDEAAKEVSNRLISLFTPDKETGARPCYGHSEVAKRYKDDPTWKDLILFHEYFHGETGEGLGASHQTGWTSLVVRLVRERAGKIGD